MAVSLCFRLAVWNLARLVLHAVAAGPGGLVVHDVFDNGVALMTLGSAGSTDPIIFTISANVSFRCQRCVRWWRNCCRGLLTCRCSNCILDQHLF